MLNYDFRGEGVRKPLLKKLDEVKPPKLHYLGTSFGFTQILLKFWSKNGYEPVYLRQTVNDITSEHSGIMLKPLENQQKKIHIENYVLDFKKRLTHLLGFEFRKLNVGLALQILHHKRSQMSSDQSQENYMDRNVLQYFISLADLNRLKSYTKNQVDYHLILDLIPSIAKLYFTNHLGRHLNLGYTNQAILVGLGLQMKSFDQICKDIKDLQVRNALPIFQKTIIKFTKLIQHSFEKQIIRNIPQSVNNKINNAVSNESQKTKKFGQQQKNKIFGDLGRQGQQMQVRQGGLVTIKRRLDEGNDFGGNEKKKKVKF